MCLSVYVLYINRFECVPVKKLNPEKRLGHGIIIHSDITPMF